MGYKRNYDINAITHGIWMMRSECTDSRTDSFISWATKQDLYRLKWLLDETLSKCSTYAPEAEWLKEQEQQRIMRILKE